MFRKKKVVWLLLLPGLAGLMLFYVVPFFGGIYSSLMDGSFENQFVGLANYERTLQNSMFQLGLKNTWELSLLCAPVIWLLAFLLAAMLKTLKDRSTAFRNILLLPYLMPSSAMLLIWTLMFDYGGIINRMVTALGIERVLWLEGDALRVPIVLLYIWKNVGFSVVLFASALSAVHPSLYEYAALEGAGWWTQSFRITLPQIMPTAFLVFVLAWVNAFKIFKEVLLHRRRVPVQRDLYLAALHEQQVRPPGISGCDDGGVHLRRGRDGAVRTDVLEQSGSLAQ